MDDKFSGLIATLRTEFQRWDDAVNDMKRVEKHEWQGSREEQDLAFKLMQDVLGLGSGFPGTHPDALHDRYDLCDRVIAELRRDGRSNPHCDDDSCDAAHCPVCGCHKTGWYESGLCESCLLSHDPV